MTSTATSVSSTTSLFSENRSSALERRITVLMGLGSALEYYDFVIYGMMAKYLKTIFFPPHSDTLAFIQFFSVFAIGYLARPFGGILAGFFGDRIGRKPVFLLLTFTMAISTLLIGLLPSFGQMGLLATLLLIVCRILQGLSFGGELPGATTIVAEFSSLKRVGFRSSLVVASVSLGALTASFVLFLMTSFFDEAEILAFGYRIPFIFGGILGLVLYIVRKNFLETPVFLDMLHKAKNKADKADGADGLDNGSAHLSPSLGHNPLKLLLQQHLRSVFLGMGLTAFVSAMIVINLYFPYFINKYYHFSEKNIYFASTISLLCSAFILPLAGHWSDRGSKDTLLKYTAGSYLLFSIIYFKLLASEHMVGLLMFMIIHQIYIAIFSACYFPSIIALFPAKVRYTGIALCYNLVYVIMANLPTMLTSFLGYFQDARIVPFVLSVMAAISFMSSLNKKCRS